MLWEFVLQVEQGGLIRRWMELTKWKPGRKVVGCYRDMRKEFEENI